MQAQTSYRVAYRYWCLISAAVMQNAILVAMFVSMAQRGTGGWPVGFIVVPLACWLGIRVLTKAIYQVDFDGEFLDWHRPGSTGRLRLADIAGVGFSWYGMEVIKMADGTRFLVPVARGLQDLIDDLAASRPDLPASLGFRGAMIDAFGLRSHYTGTRPSPSFRWRDRSTQRDGDWSAFGHGKW